MRIVLLFIVSLSLAFCGSTSSTKNAGQENGFDQVIVSGTVNLVPVGRGCWQFEDETGNKYELVGDSAKELLTDGLRARIAIRPVVGLASVCQVGTLVEVIEILEIQN